MAGGLETNLITTIQEAVHRREDLHSAAKTTTNLTDSAECTDAGESINTGGKSRTGNNKRRKLHVRWR